MRRYWKALVGIAALLVATQAAAQITLYEGEGFRGRAFNATGTIWNLEQFGFNDRASSVMVERGRWEVCEDARFSGRCVILRRGNYPSLGAMGFNNRISSLRPVNREVVSQEVPPPPPAPLYEFRVRPAERLYTVDVSSVRAIVGPPEQRCWVERQQVVQGDAPNVPGAIIGGIIGGVLGHQVGSGRGRDVATGIGAVGGAAVGANVGRGPGTAYTQDVQRCTAVPNSRPDYWDVTYWFQGVEHHVQMSAPPGRTITVNERGEPRG